jgi:hypothetical protein
MTLPLMLTLLPVCWPPITMTLNTSTIRTGGAPSGDPLGASVWATGAALASL